MSDPAKESGLSELAKRNLALLESGQYHDFVIVCGERTFKVHRNIVCTQSVMLATLCNPTWKEGSEGVANLREQDPDIVEKALRFLYTGTYDGECPCTTSNLLFLANYLIFESEPQALAQAEALLTNVRVYVLADYLDVEELRLQALANCTHLLNVHFNSPAMYEAISVALSNTKSDDPKLRRQIVRTCVKYSGAVGRAPALERLLQDQEPQAWALLLEAKSEQRELLDELVNRQRAKEQLQTDLHTRTKELERTQENLATGVKLVNTKKQCRNESCSKEFNASLETYANGYIKGLRCKRCNCRHLAT